MECEDLLGIDSILKNELRTPNETSIVVVSTNQTSNQWGIPQKTNQIEKDKPKDILLDFDVFQFANQTNENIRQTRKPRENLPVPAVVETIGNPLHSVLDDRTFAPPPPLTSHPARFDFFAERQANPSLLPAYGEVMHSGKVLSRISIKSLITKKWKEMFWIIYGKSSFIVFRTFRDYEEWILNPYLSQKERSLLIKFKIDFEKDLSVTGIRGYMCTDVRPKYYIGRGMLYQFKIDSMTTYGPSLMGAFGFAEKGEIMKLRLLLGEIMKRSTLNKSLLKLSENSKCIKSCMNQSKCISSCEHLTSLLKKSIRFEIFR